MNSKIVEAKSLHRAKAPPELQFHVAATLVSHGDPTSINPDDRQDKAGELAQFAVTVPAQFMGRLKRHHVDNAFLNLKESILAKLREHGVMAGGE